MANSCQLAAALSLHSRPMERRTVAAQRQSRVGSRVCLLIQVNLKEAVESQGATLARTGSSCQTRWARRRAADSFFLVQVGGGNNHKCLGGVPKPRGQIPSSPNSHARSKAMARP